MTSSTAVPLFSGKSHSLNVEDMVGKIFEVDGRVYVLLAIVLTIILIAPAEMTKPPLSLSGC